MLALVSLARVASQTPTVSDVGTLAWSHIQPIVPHASLALFIVDAPHGTIVARYAAGAAAPRLGGLVLGLGECLSGWVAAHARSIINSDARLDLTQDPGETLRFGLAVPLMTHGAVVGVMSLYAPEPFADDQSRMMEMIAPHLAVSIRLAVADARGPRPEHRSFGERSRPIRSARSPRRGSTLSHAPGPRSSTDKPGTETACTRGRSDDRPDPLGFTAVTPNVRRLGTVVFRLVRRWDTRHASHRREGARRCTR